MNSEPQVVPSAVAPKLCIVVPSHWEAIMGGSQYQAKILIEYLLERYEIEIFYLTALTNPSFRPHGYRIVSFSDRNGLRRYGAFFDAWRLYRALDRIKPDAILQIVGCAHTGIAAFYAKRNGCDMIWRVSSDHSLAPEPARWWQLHRRLERLFLDYGIRNARWILAQSRHQRDRLITRFGRRNVSVLPNFHPVPPEREPLPRAAKRVVWIANLKPLKNPGAFVRLARSLVERRDVRFVMVGRALMDDAWTRAQLAAIAATPNVEYLGERSQAEVEALLEQSDLLVNTSDYEGFSNTFIQAWLRRVPVVSLTVDPDELLSRHGLGALAGNERKLRDDVLRLVDAEALRAAIGARCRAYAMAQHSESNIDALARLLRVRPIPAATSEPSQVAVG